MWLKNTIMDHNNLDWIEIEETSEICTEPNSLLLEDPLEMKRPSLRIKEEPQWKQNVDDSEHGLLEDPFRGVWCSDDIHNYHKHHLGWDENKYNYSVNMLINCILEMENEDCPSPLLVPKEQLFLEDLLNREEPGLYIKEDPELILNLDDSKNNVITSTRYESDCTRLFSNSGESCGISFDETVEEVVVCNELDINEEECKHFVTSTSHTQRLLAEEEEMEDSLFGIGLQCSLKEKEFHKFSCSFCLQTFVSKYRLIMHVFIHIDGVQAPTYVCKNCGDVFPSNISLNKHLKINEAALVESAGHNNKIVNIYSNKNFLECHQEFSSTEQTHKQFSTKKTRIFSNKSLNDICNPLVTTHDAEREDRRDYGSLCTTTNISSHTVPRSGKTSIKCNICGKSFTQLCKLKKHTLIHSGNRPHKCGVCGKSFTQLQHLKTHSLTHTGMKPHKCGVCGKSFTQLQHRKIHELTHTGMRPHKCGVCGKSFTQLQHLKTHELTHTGMKPHKCGVCGKSFTDSRTLKKHALIHTGMKPHKCGVCGKSFTVSSYLRTHALIHTGLRPHTCGVCGKSFTQMQHLKYHELTHTGMKPHKCGVCGKCFTHSSNLKKHTLIHTGKRPHKCGVCDMSFTQLHHLKTHELRHTGMRPHICGVCGKSFADSSTLKKQALIHTGMRPHNCGVCGKSFTELQHLKTHELKHTGIKPHKCGVCGKSFTHLSNFKTHTLIHTEIRPHKCGVCGKSFTDSSTLRTHALRHTVMRPHK